MVKLNPTIIKDIKTFTNRFEKDAVELANAKAVALKDLQKEVANTSSLKMLEQDVVEISGKNKNIDEFELLDDVTEFSAKDAELSEFSVFEDCDNFFRQYELADDFGNDLKSEMGEFYEHLQYSIDDIPLAENIKPFRRLSKEHFSPSNYTIDTDLPYDDIIKLRRMNYSERITSRLSFEDDWTDLPIIADSAARLLDTHPQRVVDSFIDMSILNGPNGNKKLSAPLFDFVAKRSGYRKYVISRDVNGEESVNRVALRYFDKMLDETRDIPTIKEVLLYGKQFKSTGYQIQNPKLTEFAVNLYKKSHDWGNVETDIMRSVKTIYREPSTEFIKSEKINYEKIDEVNKLLKSEMSLDEIYQKVFKETEQIAE